MWTVSYERGAPVQHPLGATKRQWRLRGKTQDAALRTRKRRCRTIPSSCGYLVPLHVECGYLGCTCEGTTRPCCCGEATEAREKPENSKDAESEGDGRVHTHEKRPSETGLRNSRAFFISARKGGYRGTKPSYLAHKKHPSP